MASSACTFATTPARSGAGANRYGYGHGLTLPHVELQFSRPLNWGKVTQSE